jgi:CheY-like chemotaxis protein
LAVNATLDAAELTDQPGAKPGRYVVLSVTDNGVGIPADFQDRIFDPFFTTKPFGQGTGLGLALARGVVRGHCGFIRVASKVGEGSRFSIYLPAAAAPDPATTRTARKPMRGNGETVLIIDDERAIARLARISLESHGYTALTALSGREGVELFSRHRDTIRVVVLDLMMPDMDGPATLRALRAIDPDTRILATSGRPSTVASEAQGFLSKPYDAESLVICVHDILVGFPQAAPRPSEVMNPTSKNPT